MPRPTNATRHERLRREALAAIGVAQAVLREGRMHDYPPAERRHHFERDQITRRYFEMRDMWLEERQNASLVASWPDRRCNGGRREVIVWYGPSNQRDINDTAMDALRHLYIERSGAARDAQARMRRQREQSQAEDRANFEQTRRARRIADASRRVNDEVARRNGVVPHIRSLVNAENWREQQGLRLSREVNAWESNESNQRLPWVRAVLTHPVERHREQSWRWVGNLAGLVTPRRSGVGTPSEWEIPPYIASHSDELAVIGTERLMMRYGTDDYVLQLIAAPVSRHTGPQSIRNDRPWPSAPRTILCPPMADLIFHARLSAEAPHRPLPREIVDWLNWTLTNQLFGSGFTMDRPRFSSIGGRDRYAPAQPTRDVLIVVAGGQINYDTVGSTTDTIPLMFRYHATSDNPGPGQRHEWNPVTLV